MALIASCLAGDEAARRAFQEQFGPLIYRFAERCNTAAEVEPGDFYVYLFDDSRLFRRLASYKGMADLTAFLRGHALPLLLGQFQALLHRRKIETVSLDADDAYSATSSSTDGADGARADHHRTVGTEGWLLSDLSPEKRLLIKLLYIEDFDFDPDDFRLLAQRTGRPLHAVVEQIEQARRSVRRREAARREKSGEAESAAQWILRYDRELRRVADRLANLPAGSSQAERLRADHAELERKRAWREAQRLRATRESERATVTLRYREIAEILDAPVGSISAQITRLRQEIVLLVGKRPGETSPEQSDQGHKGAVL